MVRLKLVNYFIPNLRTTGLISLLVIASVASSKGNQADSVTIQEQENNPLNTVTVGIGRANNITEGVKFSNIGFDYLRRLNPNTAVCPKELQAYYI